MSAYGPHPCLEPGCPTLVLTPRCPTHTLALERVYRQRGHRHLYQTRRWKALSRRVLADNPICPGVGGPCGAITEDVDHLHPVEDGGPMWSTANLQALCHACHSRKTRRDIAARVYT